MGIFGWSYPPGCSGPPDYPEGPCECCGEHVDNCICPDCPVCGEYGDPACYRERLVSTPAGDIEGPPHLHYTMDQLHGQALLEDYDRSEREADRRFAEDILSEGELTA